MKSLFVRKVLGIFFCFGVVFGFEELFIKRLRIFGVAMGWPGLLQRNAGTEFLWAKEVVWLRNFVGPKMAKSLKCIFNLI